MRGLALVVLLASAASSAVAFSVPGSRRRAPVQRRPSDGRVAAVMMTESSSSSSSSSSSEHDLEPADAAMATRPAPQLSAQDVVRCQLTALQRGEWSRAADAETTASTAAADTTAAGAAAAVAAATSNPTPGDVFRCFKFASPSNKRATGPLDNFERMIKENQVYNKLLYAASFEITSALQLEENKWRWTGVSTMHRRRNRRRRRCHHHRLSHKANTA